MCGHDEHDDLRRLEAEAPQVVEGRRGIGAPARVHQNPGAAANVQNDAFSVSGTQESQLELIIPRRVTPSRHRLNAWIVSRAQLRLSRKSRSIILGGSRNTIWDTRFFVPAGDSS